MKNNISALLGVSGAYLACVGDSNTWNILAVGPRECVEVIATLAILSFMFGLLSRFIIYMFREGD